MGKHRSQTSSSVQARSVRYALSQIEPSNCHPQRQCSLFYRIPAELRTLIFEFALAEHDDTSTPLHSFGEDIRPGNIWEPRIYTDLCRTCKLIYYETSSIPLRGATLRYCGFDAAKHDLYQHKGSGTRLRIEGNAFCDFTAKQTRDFTALSYARSFVAADFRVFSFPQFRPSIISINLTPFVQRFDGWHQVHPFRTSLFIMYSQIGNITPTPLYQVAPIGITTPRTIFFPSSLKELRVTIECLHVDRPKLHTFLEGIGTQVAARQDGLYLSTAQNPITWRSWWILPGQQPTGADGKYEWQQRCHAWLTYAFDPAAPRRAASIFVGRGWDENEINEDVEGDSNRDLRMYLQNSLHEGRIESATKHAESRQESSYVRWMLAVAAQSGTRNDLIKRIPAVDATSRDWGTVTSGRAQFG